MRSHSLIYRLNLKFKSVTCNLTPVFSIIFGKVKNKLVNLSILLKASILKKDSCNIFFFAEHTHIRMVHILYACTIPYRKVIQSKYIMDSFAQRVGTHPQLRTLFEISVRNFFQNHVPAPLRNIPQKMYMYKTLKHCS